jgi:dephospho-CoA kinase
LQAKGFPVYDCDTEAKRLMVENEEIIQGLTSLVGEDAYLFDAENRAIHLNKPVVAQYLFASSENTLKVNSLVHPLVKADFLNWTLRQNSDIVFMESAILYEAHFQDVVDYTILVTAPLDVKLERAMLRDHATREQIESRMRQQQDENNIIALADHIILNDGVADVQTQVDHIINEIRKSVNK